MSRTKEQNLKRIDWLVRRLEAMVKDAGLQSGELRDFQGELLYGTSVVLTVDRLEWLIEAAERSRPGGGPSIEIDAEQFEDLVRGNVIEIGGCSMSLDIDALNAMYDIIELVRREAIDDKIRDKYEE